jgi:P-type Cu+ transporter
VNAKSELNLLASDIVALNENLWKIVSMFSLLKIARLFIIINLIWAFAYNLVMIPISSGLFYSFGFEISPILASVAMSGSSLVVVIFSNFMRCLKFDPSLNPKWAALS